MATMGDEEEPNRGVTFKKNIFLYSKNSCNSTLFRPLDFMIDDFADQVLNNSAYVFVLKQETY
jgi:hypothetical protein